jgi:protein-L-isoaspartate O-methyltransferase
MGRTLVTPKGTPAVPELPIVCIGLTAYRTIEQRTVQSMFNAMGALPYRFLLHTHTSANVWKGRNNIVDAFLSTPADYLVFIDADMVFTPGDLEKLVNAAMTTPDAGVIGGYYVSRDTNARPLISWCDDSEYRLQLPVQACIPRLLESRGKMVEADLLPTGFMLIKREVFEKVPAPWFHVKTVIDDLGEEHHFSSDNVFVHKAQDAGFKTYGHFGIELGHIGNFVFHPAQVWPQLEAYANMSDLLRTKLELGAEHGFDTKEYWDGLYAAEIEMGRVREYPELHQAVLTGIEKDWRVLDVGSGLGVLAQQIATVAREVDCLDMSTTAVEHCRSLGLTADEWNIETDDVPTGLHGAYDCVVSTEVLEHLEDPKAAVRKLYSFLKPGGMIILTVPDNRLSPDEEPEHKQVFTAAKFAGLMQPFEGGFVEPVGGYLIGVGAKPEKK